MRRLKSLDLIRGAGILVVVVLHASLYQYDGLLDIDFQHPPAVVTTIGFLLMMAGVFAIVSGSSHLFRWTDGISTETTVPREMRRSLLLTGVILIVLNFVYFQALGPTLLDIPDGHHQYSFLNGLIETGHLPAFSWERLFYNTSLSMVGWNCILMGLLAPTLFPSGKVRPGLRTPALLAGIGTVLVLASWIRIFAYPAVDKAVRQPELLVAFLGSALFNKNDPLLPYLGFALIGCAMGHAFAQSISHRKLQLAGGLFSLVWIAAGSIGYILLPDTMLERSVDEMWFAIIVMQVGLFSILVLVVWSLFDANGASAARGARAATVGPLTLCGRSSLTVFIWETPVRSLYAMLWDAVFPGWSGDLPVVILFGLTMAAIWVLVVLLWRRARFIGSMEWVIGRLYAALGRPSDKEEALISAER
jgi:uncharacterized membrane protein